MSLLLVSGAGILLWLVSVFRARRETRALRRAVRQLFRESTVHVNPALEMPELRSIWTLLSMELRALRHAQAERDAAELAGEGVGLLSRDCPDEIAQATADLVHRASNGSSAAVVVTFIESDTGRPCVRKFAGTNVERAYPLLDSIALDAALLHSDRGADGTTPTEEGTTFLVGIAGHECPELRRARSFVTDDFRMFGIGSWLVAGSEVTEPFRCVIWVGIRQEPIIPSRTTKIFVEQVASYGAAAAAYACRAAQYRALADEAHCSLLGMSHDLRTPCTTALYAVRELLGEKDGSLTRTQRDKLGVIEECIGDQLAHLRELLENARGSVPVSSVQPIPVADEVLPIFQRFRDIASARGLRLEWSMPPFLHCRCNPSHLRRIVANLLDNAIKYSDRGTIRVSGESAAGLVSLSVTDNGIGVPEGERDTLFQRFGRLSNGMGRPGRGIGLHSAARLANSNGGELSYRPEPGGGSTFVLTLESGIAAPVQSSVDEVPLKDVLIVDDDPATLRHYRRILAPFVPRIRSARSIEEAVREVDLASPSALITDLYLDGSFADAFVRGFRSRYPDSLVVIVSGQATRAFDFSSAPRIIQLEKPIGRGELLMALFGCSD